MNRGRASAAAEALYPTRPVAAGKPRALVLDGHSRAAVETVQSLGRGGVEVDVSSERVDSLAFRSRHARRCYHQPSSAELDEFVAWLRVMEAEASYSLLVPSTENSLLGLNALPEGDPLRAVSVLPSKASLDVSLNKQRTWELARAHRIPVPESILIESLSHLPPAPSFPVVLKPIHSKIKMGGRVFTLEVAIVRDERKRLEYLRAWVPHTVVQQQSYVRGHGVGLAFLYDHGRKVWHFAHERLHELPLTGGASSYRRSFAPSPELLRGSESLLGALEWHGVAMLEYKLRPDGSYCLMEINPRLWGSLALAIDAGVDFPCGLLSVAQGLQPAAQPPFRMYYTRSLNEDLVWLRQNLKSDPTDPLLLTHPGVGSLLESLRPLAGRESWDHFDSGDLGVTWAILREQWGRYVRGLGQLLRRKILARRILRRHQKLLGNAGRPPAGNGSILFLCYGNICRSPFAELLARVKLPGYRVESAGFHHTVGRASPSDFHNIALSFGVDLSGRRSARVTARHIAEADLILVMDMPNYEQFSREFPEARGRTTLLGLFAPEPFLIVDDPYHAPEAEVRHTLERICLAVDGLATVLGPSPAASEATVSTPAAAAGGSVIDTMPREP